MSIFKKRPEPAPPFLRELGYEEQDADSLVVRSPVTLNAADRRFITVLSPGIGAVMAVSRARKARRVREAEEAEIRRLQLEILRKQT
jgi:hypothetical protein